MPRVLRVAGLVALALLGTLFAVTVWPTAYHYEHTGYYRDVPPVLVRIHRFTGVVEILTSQGWERLGVKAQETKNAPRLEDGGGWDFSSLKEK